MKGIIFLVLIACILQLGAAKWFTVYYNGNNYVVTEGKNPTDGVAWAEYFDERKINGWTRFNLESSPIFADSIQAFGSGFLEAYVTYDIIYESWVDVIYNTYQTYSVPKALRDWYVANWNWTQSQLASQSADPYWIQVGLVMQQLAGLTAGYNAAQKNASRALDLIDFIFINANGDNEDLGNLVGVKNYLPAIDAIGSHCSSLIKVTDDLSELYSGHTTWGSFFTMLRVYKQYVLPYAAKATNARLMLFSSYPAFLSSVDDFYHLSTKLIVTETTNGCMNNTLMVNNVKPTSLLSWVRVIVANRMAVDGEDWIKIFSRYNSGTYNNQWIIVNYNKFTPYVPLQPGTLFIAEQMPGEVLSADVTDYLRLGYWPSFNIPFFATNFDKCAFPSMVQKYGSWFTYSMSPRGEIFRRQANAVKDLVGEMDFLRYNDWTKDPLAQGNPGNQISSRFDLVPSNVNPLNPFLTKAAFGGIDSKVTSYKLVNMGESYAQSGPTRGGAKNNIPAFDWNDWPQVVHLGMPDVYDFDWVSMPSGVPVKV